MSLLQTLIFAIIQGITELFPISSVAHGVLTPFALGWDLSPTFLKEHFLPFVVMLHLGTASALLLFFWRDWLALALGLVGGRDPAARRTLALIIVGTLPAALIGLVFEKLLRGLFSSPGSAAFFLIINGFILFFGERWRGRGQDRIEDLSYGKAALIGLAQAAALVPGFSRSGASMVAGFAAGLTHGESARFSMLLATPIIAGASLLEVPKLLRQGDPAILHSALIGGVAAGVFAFLSVWALMTWFRRQEVDAMRPFAFYCWIVGALALGASLL